MNEDPRAVLLAEDNADDADLTIRGLKRANLQTGLMSRATATKPSTTGTEPANKSPNASRLSCCSTFKLPRIHRIEVRKRIRPRLRPP